MSGLGQGGHMFERASFSKLTYCQLCHELIWGLISEHTYTGHIRPLCLLAHLTHMGAQNKDIGVTGASIVHTRNASHWPRRRNAPHGKNRMQKRTLLLLRRRHHHHHHRQCRQHSLLSLAHHA
jgi:hypothetical protein